jgi:hypothetical protein
MTGCNFHFARTQFVYLDYLKGILVPSIGAVSASSPGSDASVVRYGESNCSAALSKSPDTAISSFSELSFHLDACRWRTTPTLQQVAIAVSFRNSNANLRVIDELRVSDSDVLLNFFFTVDTLHEWALREMVMNGDFVAINLAVEFKSD